MRYVVMLIAITIGLMGLSMYMAWPESARGWFVFALLIFLTVSFGVTAALYFVWAGFGVESGRLTKRSDGRTRWGLTWVLLFPSTVLSRLSLWLRHVLTNEPKIQEIDEGLYLGRRLGSRDFSLFCQSGVSAVVDLCAEISELGYILSHPGIQYLSEPVLDGLGPSVRQMREVTEWVSRQRRAGHKVLIHCALGHSRSAVFAACVLLSEGKVQSIDHAVNLLQQQRRRVRLHRGQWRSARKFAAAMEAPEQVK